MSRDYQREKCPTPVQALEKAVRRLPIRERLVLKLTTPVGQVLPKTQDELALMLGCSRSRISELEITAIKKIRAAFELSGVAL